MQPFGCMNNKQPFGCMSTALTGRLRLGQDRFMTRVPYSGNEKASLFASLDRHRDAILWKLEGPDQGLPDG
jgi:hypothetical protein